jgi:hypothetical protein
MSYRLKIRLAAEADVAEAAQWYNQRQPGLGENLIREVDQAIARILENPLAFPVILRLSSAKNRIPRFCPKPPRDLWHDSDVMPVPPSSFS